MPQFEMAVEDNTRMTFITEEDKQKLRDTASRDVGKKTAVMKGVYLKCFVELLFGFGWRKGELTGLAVGNANLAENFIRLDDSKNGEPREVPLTASLRVLLAVVIAGRSSEESLFTVRDMRHAWKRLCKSAGVKCGKAAGYVIHDTRRTAARTKRAVDVSETVTCKIMGWKPGSKMFARYGIVDRADMAEALTRVLGCWDSNTLWSEMASISPAPFQSTPAHGRQLYAASSGGISSPCFNPRPRTADWGGH